MTPFPHADMVLRVDSTPTAAAARLAKRVAAKRFRLRRPVEPFEGYVSGTRFQLMRTVGYLENNSFVPVVLGEITGAHEGTEVRIQMRLHRFVAAFMGVWLCGVVVIVGAMTLTLLRASPDLTVGLAASGVLLAAGAAMLGFGYWLMRASFRSEAKKATVLLCEVLGAVGGPAGRA